MAQFFCPCRCSHPSWSSSTLRIRCASGDDIGGPDSCTCPETGRFAAVTIDVAHAATTAFIEHQADVRLADCSGWTSRGPCREPCLPNVLAAGHAGSVDAIVEHWYARKVCHYCRAPLTDVTSSRHCAALVGPDGITTEWSEVAPEHLPELFLTQQPVCWNCHMTETFRRLHPDLYVDRQGSDDTDLNSAQPR